MEFLTSRTLTVALCRNQKLIYYIILWFPPIVQTCNIFFILWNRQGDVRQNVHAALFHTMKINGDGCRQASLWESANICLPTTQRVCKGGCELLSIFLFLVSSANEGALLLTVALYQSLLPLHLSFSLAITRSSLGRGNGSSWQHHTAEPLGIVG